MSIYYKLDKAICPNNNLLDQFVFGWLCQDTSDFCMDFLLKTILFVSAYGKNSKYMWYLVKSTLTVLSFKVSIKYWTPARPILSASMCNDLSVCFRKKNIYIIKLQHGMQKLPCSYVKRQRCIVHRQVQNVHMIED